MNSVAVCIENSFTYHPPSGTQQERYVRLREKGKELALLINECCPPSADRSTAFEKVREAVMWANASIACNEVAVPPKQVNDGE